MSYKPSGVDLQAGQYTIKKSAARNKYKVVSPNGAEVLRTKQKLLKMKEEFPITNADGQAVAQVKAGGILDIAGDYTLVDNVRGVELFVFDKNLTLTLPKWEIKDAQTGELVVSIKPRSGLRRFILPTYDVVAPNGDKLGAIEKEFTFFRSAYTVDVSGLRNNGLREAVIIAAMVVDALDHSDD